MELRICTEYSVVNEQLLVVSQAPGRSGLWITVDPAASTAVGEV
jgi:hypothetical protein